ncbi:MAG: hypothetical protein ACI85Q_002038 [Salibacteraceae bacterium]|jgi:hypothetical protein
MKHIFTLLSFLGLGLISLAQETHSTVPEIPTPIESTPDTSEVHMNGKKIIIITNETNKTSKSKVSTKTVSIFSQKRNRVWQGFEIGFTGVSYTPEFNTEVPAGSEFFEPIVSSSINWAINPFELDIRIIGEYLKFSTGLGYTARNFTLANNYLLEKEGSGVTTGAQDATRKLDRNRFRTGYITIPAMLYFNSNKNPQKAFRMGGGIVYGARIFEAYRLKYDQNGHHSKEKYNGGYNANPILLDLRAVVGYGGINLYATYSTKGLFNPGFGPEVYPYTVGISFVNNY